MFSKYPWMLVVIGASEVLKIMQEYAWLSIEELLAEQENIELVE